MSVKVALVIEDDFGISESLQMFMQLEGFIVDCAENGQAGLERIKVLYYDLILIDYRLPDMTGDKIAKIARYFCPGTILIGMSLEDRSREFVESGADVFIIKDRLITELMPYVSLIDSQTDNERNASRSSRHTF